jgi:hypothetical protein
MTEPETHVGNYRWIAQAWAAFAQAITDAGDNEEQIKQICEAEIASWRARPTMKKENSLKTPMTKMRNKLKDFSFTEKNSWVNPKTNKREHLARKYLNFTIEEWAQINLPAEKSAEDRSEHQPSLEDPDGIVKLASQLLESNRWDDIVVGLAVATGRRLSEVLKTGQFFPSTRFTVMFAGQLKRRDKALAPFEIPTLVESSLVLQAWERLHSLLDCSQLSVEKVSHDYSPKVKATAIRWYKSLVPLSKTAKHQDLYTHLFRSVYGCIAVFWFCPEGLSHIDYLATIMGQYWVLEAQTKQLKRDRVAALHYDDYQIGNKAILKAEGQRKGVKLKDPGVSVIKAFQHLEEQSTPIVEGEFLVSSNNDQTLTLADAKKHSIIRVSQHTRQLFDAAAEELKTSGLDDTLQELLVRSNLYGQLVAALEPLSKALDSKHPIDTVVAIQKQGVGAPKKSSKKSKEQLELEKFVQEVGQQTDQPLEYLRGLIEKDAHYKAGYDKRHANVDFQALSMEQLAGIKTEKASNERFRRAVDAIIAHNIAMANEPLKQWHINPGSVRALVGGRHPAVKAYVESRAEEIQKHHDQYKITEVFNRKPPALGIKTMIVLEQENETVEFDEVVSAE